MSDIRRIAHVCADRGIDITGTKGAAVHLRSLATAFSDRAGVTVHVARVPALATDGLPFEVVPFRGDDELTSSIISSDPDVVYERYSLGAAAGLRAAQHLGVPFVLEMNAPLVVEATAYRPDTVSDEALAVEEVLLAESDLVVTVSTVLRDHVQTRRGDRPTVVVPNGCEPALFERSPDRRTTPTIGFLGHPKPWHGAGRLLDILAGVRARGIDARLSIVGGGDGASDLAAAADERGLGGFVDISGPVDHATAAALIGESWVGVAPYEPNDFFYFCPLKVIEYMAAGVPTVASNLGDIPALLDGGGILVEAADIDGFVDATADLLADPDHCRALGATGRRRALETLTWSDAADATLAAIRAAGHVRGAPR